MLAYTYISHGKFELIDKPKPELQGPRDAIVRIMLGSICTSDLHIKHDSVPRAVPGAYGFPYRCIAIVSSPPSYGTNLQNDSLFKC